jgi:cell wall-associated NlpC family hydrolase
MGRGFHERQHKWDEQSLSAAWVFGSERCAYPHLVEFSIEHILKPGYDFGNEFEPDLGQPAVDRWAVGWQSLDDQEAKISADIARLEALKKKVAAQQPKATVAATPRTPPPYVAGRAGIAVNFAYAQLGKPYEWAAAGPSSYDCSGLTLAAWRAAGVYLPHNAAMQYNSLPHIRSGSLRPGDLVFYEGLGHEGIYVGNGQVIHAPTFGDHVRVASVDMMPPHGYARPS